MINVASRTECAAVELWRKRLAGPPRQWSAQHRPLHGGDHARRSRLGVRSECLARLRRAGARSYLGFHIDALTTVSTLHAAKVTDHDTFLIAYPLQHRQSIACRESLVHGISLFRFGSAEFFLGFLEFSLHLFNVVGTTFAKGSLGLSISLLAFFGRRIYLGLSVQVGSSRRIY